eukprot:CAMPEP_0172358460 /NCGR_PEP_ID=MMETSP1060-20121228/2778_1 /TAXON_ID=37318 /ORGANISM="Pseudo-nitzschia pungens, Strain cf. cingulata" /LENGTH=583 /DNA_ID=CAMNT_0013079687 /DNA_START=200 /DNA_END=1951 /DNA_ORIENTATION=+
MNIRPTHSKIDEGIMIAADSSYSLKDRDRLDHLMESPSFRLTKMFSKSNTNTNIKTNKSNIKTNTNNIKTNSINKTNNNTNIISHDQHHPTKDKDSTKTNIPNAQAVAVAVAVAVPVPVPAVAINHTACDEEKKRRRKKKKKWTKPEGKPKRPLSAYNIFFAEERILMLGKDVPTAEQEAQKKKVHCKTHGKISFAVLARTIGTKWKALPPSERKTFEDRARAEKDRYLRELAVWKEEQDQLGKKAGGVVNVGESLSLALSLSSKTGASGDAVRNAVVNVVGDAVGNVVGDAVGNAVAKDASTRTSFLHTRKKSPIPREFGISKMIGEQEMPATASLSLPGRVAVEDSRNTAESSSLSSARRHFSAMGANIHNANHNANYNANSNTNTNTNTNSGGGFSSLDRIPPPPLSQPMNGNDSYLIRLIHEEENRRRYLSLLQGLQSNHPLSDLASGNHHAHHHSHHDLHPSSLYPSHHNHHNHHHRLERSLFGRNDSNQHHQHQRIPTGPSVGDTFPGFHRAFHLDAAAATASASVDRSLLRNLEGPGENGSSLPFREYNSRYLRVLEEYAMILELEERHKRMMGGN